MCCMYFAPAKTSMVLLFLDSKGSLYINKSQTKSNLNPFHSGFLCLHSILRKGNRTSSSTYLHLFKYKFCSTYLRILRFSSTYYRTISSNSFLGKKHLLTPTLRLEILQIPILCLILPNSCINQNRWFFLSFGFGFWSKQKHYWSLITEILRLRVPQLNKSTLTV